MEPAKMKRNGFSVIGKLAGLALTLALAGCAGASSIKPIEVSQLCLRSDRAKPVFVAYIDERAAAYLGDAPDVSFAAYAEDCSPTGPEPAIADALAFIEFMFRQNRVALAVTEYNALRSDRRMLVRRFRLKREGNSISVVEKWKILQWLHL